MHSHLFQSSVKMSRPPPPLDLIEPSQEKGREIAVWLNVLIIKLSCQEAECLLMKMPLHRELSEPGQCVCPHVLSTWEKLL